MDRKRRSLVTLATGSLALAAAPLRAQQADTVRILVGFATGGTSDVTARRVAERLQRDGYAKSVIVENRTGAGGQIALTALKTVAPDGLTIVQTPMSMLGIYAHTYKKLPYDPFADFAPVSMAVRFDMGFAVGPLVPASVRTANDFAAWAKANPKDANYGSPAAGSVPHFVGELFSQRIGVPMKHAPYRGTQPAIVDMMGGQVAAVSGPVGEFLQHIPTGKVRLLATSGPSRSRFTPSVATFAEQGFKDIVHDEWFGYFVPAKTPPETIAKLSAALATALAAPEVIDSLGAMGLEAKSTSPAELGAILRRDSERWAPLIKAIGFTADS